MKTSSCLLVIVACAAHLASAATPVEIDALEGRTIDGSSIVPIARTANDSGGCAAP